MAVVIQPWNVRPVAHIARNPVFPRPCRDGPRGRRVERLSEEARDKPPSHHTPTPPLHGVTSLLLDSTPDVFPLPTMVCSDVSADVSCDVGGTDAGSNGSVPASSSWALAAPSSSVSTASNAW